MKTRKFYVVNGELVESLASAVKNSVNAKGNIEVTIHAKNRVKPEVTFVKTVKTLYTRKHKHIKGFADIDFNAQTGFIVECWSCAICTKPFLLNIYKNKPKCERLMGNPK